MATKRTDSERLDEPVGELTVAYRTLPPGDDEQAGQATVAFVSQIGYPRGGDEIRQMLRKRLRFFALFLSGGLVLTLIVVAVLLKSEHLDKWLYFVIFTFALGPVSAVILWRRPSLSLLQLRAVELVLFGAMYAQWAMVHAFLYPTMTLRNPPVWFGVIQGYAVSMPWIFLIIIYGIFIPNTWQRCAVVVGVMACTPLIVSVANGFAVQVTAGHSPAFFLGAVAACMAAAVAIAVYGSHRIEVLRQEVLAARQLGPYRLGRKLGAGGMGEVYLAEHLLLRRPCAVKMIRPERAGDPENWRRFEREVQTTATLTHPNTIQIYDYGHADDGTFYYAMEYLPGLTLEQMVTQHGPFPAGRAIYLLRQICGALGEAHAAGLVHRDIKPSNIIVCERGGQHDVAKLLDFGLVLVQTSGASSTEKIGVAGTPAYMPAEQADGLTQPDARSDLYSLGAVAFFLIAGEPPFVRRTLSQLRAAHRTEAVTFPEAFAKQLPEDLKAVVLRCLEKDPAHRFRNVGELELAFAACTDAGSWTQGQAGDWWKERDVGILPAS